jgi:hypothetical protein
MSLSELENQLRKVSTLSDALNMIEKLMTTVHQLFNRIEELEKENARLKKQSNKPHVKSPDKLTGYSSNPYLPKNKKKGKSVKQILVDRHENLPETEICSCGSNKFTPVRTWNKLVQGLTIRRDNVLYHGNDKKCCQCGKIHHSILPPGVSGYQFSSELKSWLSVLKYDCRMSELVIERFLSGIGVKISAGHINRIILENSNALVPGYTHLKVWGLKLSRYLHSDATGLIRQIMKTGKRLHQHLHFAGHQYLSLFKVTSRYNSFLLGTKVLGKRAMEQIYISDDGSPNGENLPVKRKQLCWIHEIRHFLKLWPKVRIHQQQLMKVIDQLWQFYLSAKDYGRDPTPEKKQYLQNLFDGITGQQTAYQELVNRLKLTRRKKNRLLLFLDYPGIPIENNLAERDLRPAVIIRKISGGTKSDEGDRSFERHMSIIQTAHKQNLNIFDTVHGLITGTLDPFILTRKVLPAFIS